MRAAGATEEEINNKKLFDYAYAIFGPGQMMDQTLLALAPLAAKSAIKFDRQAMKAQRESNARIDGISPPKVKEIVRQAIKTPWPEKTDNLIQPKLDEVAKELDNTRGSPPRVVLGLDKYLDDFATAQGGKKVLRLAADPMNWKSDFDRLMSDPSQQISFNLKDVDVWAGVSRASSGRGFGATDWELLRIYSNKEWWPRIKWFDEFGNLAPNPFE